MDQNEISRLQIEALQRCQDPKPIPADESRKMLGLFVIYGATRSPLSCRKIAISLIEFGWGELFLNTRVLQLCHACGKDNQSWLLYFVQQAARNSPRKLARATSPSVRFLSI